MRREYTTWTLWLRRTVEECQVRHQQLAGGAALTAEESGRCFPARIVCTLCDQLAVSLPEAANRAR